MSKKAKPLTPKEMNVLKYVEQFIAQNGFAPTFTEIKDHFGFASYNSIQRYLKQLQGKNYIHMPGGNQKRAITIINSSDSLIQSLEVSSKETAYSKPIPFPSREAPSDERSESLSLPLLGSVAAGIPLEAVRDHEFVDVPLSLVKNPSKAFALTVEGNSMIDDGIFDGDTLIIKPQSEARNGEIVVAVVDNEATVKRLYHQSGSAEVELRPSNTSMQSMHYPAKSVQIKGVLSGLIRKF